MLAVDVEPDMVRYIRERAAREHLDNVRPVLASVDDPMLPAQGVDRVLIVDTWHHIPSRSAYVAKLRAALAPGATITLVDLTRDAPFGPPREMRVLPDSLVGELRAGGLAADLVELGLPYQFVVMAHP